MDSRNPPVLTSPWKIGFFVSLMLVTVSAGVSYFFQHAFGLSWGLPAFEPSIEWLRTQLWSAISGPEGFVFQVWPLVVLVSVSAMVSHLVITRAVRKYKRYLDSGLDYKNLISSLRDIDDLEDQDCLDPLKNHPELKEFLKRVRRTWEDRSAQLDERERSLDGRLRDGAKQRGEEQSRKFTSDCATLADAMHHHDPSSFPADLELSTIELKRVEEALRDLLRRIPRPGDISFADTSAADDDHVRDEALQKEIARLTEEFGVTESGAMEIGKAVSSWVHDMENVPVSPGVDNIQAELKSIASSIESLTGLSSSVAQLSDEAKGIAINTAMRASSYDGPQEELVELADDIKDIASKFSDMAKSYASVTSGMKSAVDAVASQTAGIHGEHERDTGHTEAARELTGKIAAWCECVRNTAEALRKLNESSDGRAGGRNEAPVASAPDADGASTADSDPIERFGFESFDGTAALLSDTPGEPSGAKDGVAAQDGTPKKSDIPTAAPKQSKPDATPTPTGKKEPALESSSPPTESEDELFADLSGKTAAQDTLPGAAKSVDRRSQTAAYSADPNAVSLDPKKKVSSPPEPRPAPGSDVEDIMDLYALGAVDFDPALHG